MGCDRGLDAILLERVRFGELYDAYSPILTEKQREVCELFLGEDLSVSELGVTLGMSRQGAYDLARRSLERLGEIERLLGLLELQRAHKSLVSLIEENRDILPGEFLDRARRFEGRMTSERNGADV
ncbi:MAG: DNA-binding protein [Synergistaceae bacterium]|nr:DNA-binding protein [Synergistaceae bacterium]